MLTILVFALIAIAVAFLVQQFFGRQPAVIVLVILLLILAIYVLR